MVDKLNDYVGVVGRVHLLRDEIREKRDHWREQHPLGIIGTLKETIKSKSTDIAQSNYEDFVHVYRKKTRKELVRVSAAVMGIEFSYAAETAFVSPTLLKIGVEHRHMTLVWALSPLVGFFVTPILGSLSDKCSLSLGRRRPFIIMMAIGVLIGLILVPNGEYLGYKMGDYKRAVNLTPATILAHRTSAVTLDSLNFNATSIPLADEETNSHPWGVFFTILGTVLLDFDADACQSPSRAYLLDVTLPEDHARGLSTFTVMAGLGGFFGYALGGINWDVTALGALLGGHVRAVFTLITFIFIVCVTYTITSFREIPLKLLEQINTQRQINPDDMEDVNNENRASYGSIDDEKCQTSENSDYNNLDGINSENENDPNAECQPNQNAAHAVDASLTQYLQSIIFMPQSMRILCLTNLFCWMAHVCYSLYFTDFVGEAVFQGNPTAIEGTETHELYEQGVRFGCWGMSLYSLSCACYSLVIEKLIVKFGARRVYVGGLLVYCTGMFLMAVTKHKVGVILFSWTAGVMYSTLFTMPYLLIAHYHAKGTFEQIDENVKTETQVRGLGTDIALVSSMVFLAQFILSMCMGTIVSVSGTTTAVVSVASFLSFCGAMSATQVLYLDL